MRDWAIGDLGTNSFIGVVVMICLIGGVSGENRGDEWESECWSFAVKDSRDMRQ